ncbi:F-box protein At3g26010-like [Silene latifolia]|uniref:F-box protein At3g26010-like n=1 Tax=Silene latifolia TaxID=37657 RepID=UPI003D782A11
MARPKKIQKINHGGNRTRIDDLDDHMLAQILLRLPNCKTVLACSAVNKRWCSLISDSNFHSQFANHKKNTTTLLKGYNEPPWTFLTTVYGSEERLLTTEFIFEPKLSLEFLPCNKCTTRATFKDLVLCSSYKPCQEGGGRVYYITNPLTKQWVALPPCPWGSITWTGFICQPLYSDTKRYKFRVVLARYRVDKFDLVVYCSEIGEWKEFNLRIPKEVGSLNVNTEEPEIVICNGIVYFKTGLRLVALDPFDVNDNCDTTTLEARIMPPLPGLGYLQESSGQLFVLHTPEKNGEASLPYQKDGTAIKLQLVMWKLNLNQESLVWETTFQGLCKGTVNYPDDPTFEGYIDAKDIGVHPYNEKLIYIHLSREKKVVLCDTRTCCITSLKRSDHVGRFHRLEQQWWPTSVPALVQCLTDSQN